MMSAKDFNTSTIAIGARVKCGDSGYTTLEIVMALILVSIIAATAFVPLESNLDAQRFEQTRQRMQAIRIAILGDDRHMDNEGRRSHFGYHGDMGRLPANLGELMSQGPQPAWNFNVAQGIGAGWRGPYLSKVITGGIAYDRDAFGRPFIYDSTASPPTLISYGADGVTGGSGIYDKDLIVEFPGYSRLSRVRGLVLDGEARLSSRTVEIAYPSSGSLTLISVSSDANGFFEFSNIPFGVRALGVTTPPSLKSRQTVVDRSDFSTPTSLLNYAGNSESVTYVPDSAHTGSSSSTVLANLKSTYTSTLQLDKIKCTWSSGGTLSSIILNGAPNGIVPAAASGVEIDVDALQIIYALSESNGLELRFSGAMSGVAVTAEFTWANRTRSDTLTFTP